LLDTAICFTQISCLCCNIRFQLITFLFNDGELYYQVQHFRGTKRSPYRTLVE
jgi:hypothetical protein